MVPTHSRVDLPLHSSNFQGMFITININGSRGRSSSRHIIERRTNNHGFSRVMARPVRRVRRYHHTANTATKTTNTNPADRAGSGLKVLETSWFESGAQSQED